MKSEIMIKEIIEMRKNWNRTSDSDFEWLINQAEQLGRIIKAWINIETNGTVKEANDFYNIVQDILIEDY